MKCGVLKEAARKAEREYNGSCVVYFAQAGDRGPIKIGTTTEDRVHRRIQELQNGSPWRVVLRRAIPGSRELETALHRLFASARMNGEWFYPTISLASLALADPSDAPAAA